MGGGGGEGGGAGKRRGLRGLRGLTERKINGEIERGLGGGADEWEEVGELYERVRVGRK